MTPETQVIGPVHGAGPLQDGATGKGADLVPPPSLPSPVPSLPSPVPSLEQVREYIRASKAENTLRGYQSDWRDFCAWCETNKVCPLPASAETVASYIAECAGRLKPAAFSAD